MQIKGNRDPEVSLSLFVDDSEDSTKARRAIESIQEPCNLYHIRELNMVAGDEIDAPLLYAPEGIFRGWKQIQAFLKIPQSMRYKTLVPE